MPTGVYIRSAAVRAAASARAKRVGIVSRLLSPEVKARATSVRKACRQRATGYYALVGTGVKGRTALAHRVRAEIALGRCLPSGVVIHHPDRDIHNPLARIVICENHAYHMLLHKRERRLHEFGNANVALGTHWSELYHARRAKYATERELEK